MKPSASQLVLLKHTIDAVYTLPHHDWEKFASYWRQVAFTKKQTITAPGNIEQYLYFVTEGVQRVFSLDEADREATVVFTYAPSFGGVIDSLLLQQPSRYYYEAISSSVLLAISYDHLYKLMKERSAINEFVSKALTISLGGLLERLVELQSFTSEEKFRKLMHRSPHILQLVPQKYLANYIGIDATNFSKLMNSIRI
jgi:CRP-like cAMP-binding protein